MQSGAERTSSCDASNLAINIDGCRRRDLKVLVIEHGTIGMCSLPPGERPIALLQERLDLRSEQAEHGANPAIGGQAWLNMIDGEPVEQTNSILRAVERPASDPLIGCEQTYW